MTQRLLSALVAILSFSSMLFGANTLPTAAQDRPGAENDAAVRDPAKPDTPTAPLVLPRGVTWENVDVKDRPLIIQGDVKGSVHAVNSKVTMLPGSRVEGSLTIVGGTLSAGTGQANLVGNLGRPASEEAGNGSSPHHGNWFGGQFLLWLLGLAGGVILLVAAPDAANRVTDAVSMQPGRSLMAGALAGAVMLAALAVSGAIMATRSWFSLLWTPVMILIVLATLFLLIFGWLTGMKRVGDLLAQRFGQTGSGSFYGRMTLGLSAFFLVNTILGAIHIGSSSLGVMGLLAEFAVALMGIGAIVQTGFGREDAWLGRRLGHVLRGNRN